MFGAQTGEEWAAAVADKDSWNAFLGTSMIRSSMPRKNINPFAHRVLDLPFSERNSDNGADYCPRKLVVHGHPVAYPYDDQCTVRSSSSIGDRCDEVRDATYDRLLFERFEIHSLCTIMINCMPPTTSVITKKCPFVMQQMITILVHIIAL